MNEDERAMLEDWTARLVVALGIADFDPDVDGVLELAGAAARTVVRPAAPITTFLVGYAAGWAAASGSDPEKAVAAATRTAVALGDAG